MRAFLLAAFLAATPHPDSLSSSRVRVHTGGIDVTVRCQVMSLLEVIPDLDANRDEAVDAAEVAGRRDAILAYVAEHFRLTTGTDRAMEGGRRLVAEPVAVRHLTGDSTLGIGARAGAVDVELRYPSPEPIRDVVVEVSLFHATSPAHIDLCTVEWDGHEPEGFAIDARTPRVRSDPEGRGAFLAFLRLGVGHILGGFDHIAFVIALLLSARSLRALLAVVTAFTAAHSVSLALAALRVVDVSAYASVVEATIALSIAFVGADNLLHPKLVRPRWIEAFVFGLVHGLGFAGFLGQSLVNERAKAMALFSFNVGVEVGQVAIVVLLVAGLRFLHRRSEEDPFLAPLRLRQAGSAIVTALGLWWFFERI